MDANVSLEWFLGSMWVAGTLPILIASIPSPTLSPVHNLILSLAKRGKIMDTSSSQILTVPQRFFLHFYVLAVAWTTFLVVVMWHYACMSRLLKNNNLEDYVNKVWTSLFLLLLMETQVMRRLYETLFVFNYAKAARMHVLGYFTGIYFYMAAPISLCHPYALEAFKLFGVHVMGNKFDCISYLKPSEKLGWYHWVGAGIFAWGWIHQFRCHAILGSSRAKKKETDHYVIPHGDWFEVVSSPHYSAEIIIYTGLVVASGGTDTLTWLLLLFVVANLTFAAAETQRWYVHKFEDYPKNRWAIIPFLC